ncbi:MAG TPA: conjugal transfer protein TraN [Burkholderiaceae bacterium]|nr:conjugal transfer protein TraN [Burkholderiaceae bacterium]
MRLRALFLTFCAALSAAPRVSAAPSPPTIQAQLLPSVVQAGNSYTLTWSATNTTAITFSCSGAVSANEQLSPVPSGIRQWTATAAMVGTTTCVLTASGPGGSATSAPLTLVVQDAPTSATCRVTGTTCVDGPATRVINGQSIYRECWQYAQQYECIEGGSFDYCAPFASAGCTQTNSACLQRAFDGRCMLYENDWRCANPLQPEPPNVVRLPDTYTITRDDIDSSACDVLAATNGCTQTAARTCVEGPQTRNINGLDVYKDCWRWTETYTCIGANGEASDCAQYESDPACRFVSEECVDNTIGTVCGVRYRRYDCQRGATAPVQVTTCGGTVCIAGVCDATDTPPDQDFGRAITALEIARQAATYGDVVGDRFFTGKPDWCKRTFGAISDSGLFSCCGSKVVYNASNKEMAVAKRILSQAVAEVIKYLGSVYMHDLLAMLPQQILNYVYGSATAGAAAAQGTYSFSYAGVSYSSTAGFQVNWAAFWYFVIVLAVSLYAECDQEEHLLSLKKGQNLCHYVGRFCSEREPDFLRRCRKYKDGYCCFNSKLARIVQQQGRAQLGLGWGSAQSPDCRGLTLAEIQSLDFSRMDFSEFIADVGWHSAQTDPQTGVQTLRVDPPQVNIDAARARAPGRATELRNAPTPYFPPNWTFQNCVPPNC